MIKIFLWVFTGKMINGIDVAHSDNFSVNKVALARIFMLISHTKLRSTFEISEGMKIVLFASHIVERNYPNR